MGGGNALEVLEHYKNKILRYTNDETVLLHCLNKLDMVNVTIQLLQETMIGKTVGLIKKQYGDGPVGVQAKALVTKWKEVVRVEEEQAQIRANSEEEMNESAPGSPQSAVNQSAENSADNQSADDAESAVVKTEYIPTPLIPTYTPTPINQLETDSSSESARKQHKHKKSSREKDKREKQSRDGQREKEEYRRDKEGERRKVDGRKEKEGGRSDKDKDHKSSSRGSREEGGSSRSSKEEGGSSRSIKEEGKSSSRSHDKDKERERRKHQEREDSKRKDKKESRDEEKGSSRHKREETEEEREKRKKETEEEREKRKKHSHSKEHSSSRKIKEEPNTRKIKEEPSERSSKEETSSRSSKEHTSSRKIKEEPLFNMDQLVSSRKSKEESSSSRNGKHEHSSSRKIKEEKPSSSSSKSDRQELSCDVLEDRATNNSGSESNCDITTTGEKDKTSDFKHKKDKKDKHKDRDSKRDKERSHKSNEKRPELMELDMFSQIPTDSNKEKSRKRHRNEGESSDSSEKRRKVENGKPSSSNSSLPAALCIAPSLALAPGGPLATSGLSLPEISPHYKPLPRAPLQSRHQPSEEDRLDELMGKKKGRSEIYSGKKRQRFFGEVPSLFDQCILKLQDHVDDIDEVGDLTFDILKPVLERAAPQTLMHIEDLNQELMTGPTNTSELWEKHCQRDFRNKKREEMESWREMYERCTTERERKLDLLKGKIKKTTVTDKAALRHCKLAYPDVVAKPPRDVAIKQAKHGTGLPTGTVTKVGAVVRPKVSDPTAGNSRPSTVKKHKVPPNLAKVKTMMKGMSRFGRR